MEEICMADCNFTINKREEVSQSAEPRVCRLWLVRHGATEWNQQWRLCGHHDVPLSEKGRLQAKWLGQRLRLESIAAIYSSDLQRASETARLLAASLPDAVPLHLEPAWREMSFGDWEGLTYQEISASYQEELKFFTDPVRFTPPNGEAFPSLVLRVRNAFADLARELASPSAHSGDVVLVSHGGTLRALLCSLLEMPFERQWQIRLDHGSLSALDFVPGAEDVSTTVTLALLNAQALPREKGAEAHV
jgi:alpha-ribazole phosphatase